LKKIFLSCLLLILASCGKERVNVCDKVNENLLSEVMKGDFKIVGKFEDWLGNCRVVFIDKEKNFEVGSVSVGFKGKTPYAVYGVVIVNKQIPDLEKEKKYLEIAFKESDRMKLDYWWSRLGKDFDVVKKVGRGERWIFLVINEFDMEAYDLEKEAKRKGIEIVVMKPKDFDRLVGKFPLPFYTLLKRTRSGEVIKVYLETKKEKPKKGKS